VSADRAGLETLRALDARDVVLARHQQAISLLLVTDEAVAFPLGH
jgi:hypothetical protein